MSTTNNTIELTPPVHTRNQSEGNPFTPRHLIRQAQLPQMTIDRSDVKPLNLTKGKSHIQDNKRGSPVSSMLRRNFTQQELRAKINIYSAKLKAYEGKRAKNVTKENQKANLDNIQKPQQKRVSSYHQKVLQQMLMLMENHKVKGFVYGMVTDTSKPISGASDSLRAWWKNEVKFDISGVTQTDIYCKQNSLSSNVVEESDVKSTTELLMELSDPTLGSILSLIMQHCDPPQRKFPFEKGLPPPWWPTTQEGWWSQTGISTNEGPPPYKKPHDIRKKWKVAVIIGIIKFMSPNFSSLHSIVEQSRYLQSRMKAKERKFWNLALVAEAKKYYQEHRDMPVDEAIAFLHASGSTHISQVSPKIERQDISGREASRFNPFGVVHRPRLAPSSDTPSAYPLTVPLRSLQQNGVQESRIAPKPQMAMSGSFSPQNSAWVFSHNPNISANVPINVEQDDTIGGLAASGSRLQGHHALPLDELVHQSGASGIDGTQYQKNKYWHGANMKFGF